MADIRSLIGRDREMVRKAAMREEQLDKAVKGVEESEDTTSAPPTAQSVTAASTREQAAGPSAGAAGSATSAQALSQAMAEATGEGKAAKGKKQSAAQAAPGTQAQAGADGAAEAGAAAAQQQQQQQKKKRQQAPKPPMPKRAAKAAPKPPMPAAAAKAEAEPEASEDAAPAREFLDMSADPTAPAEARRARKATAAGAAAAAATGKGSSSGPATTAAAIEAGIGLYERGDYANALTLFSAALELPGAGVARYASSPREYRCASDGEVQSALYNAACCHAQLGNAAEALEALEGAMENGFDDFDAALADDDLAPAGKGKLEELINKFNNPVGKLFRKTTKGKRSATSWLRLGF